MPFQHSHGTAASTQLLSASTSEHSKSGFSAFPPAIASKSALADPSSKPHSDQRASSTAPARKQHHVSFKEDPEPSAKNAKQSSRNQHASQSSSRPDTSDLRDRASEHGSSRHSASRASSRQSRRDASEPGSSKSVASEGAPSTSSRQRRSRHRSDKRSERSHTPASDHAAKSNTEDAGPLNSRCAPSSRSEASTSPHKRDARTKDGSSSGKRSRQHSTQENLPDLRGPEASRSEAGPRSHHSHSSRRDRFALSHDARSMPGESSTSRSSRQLFDPRRDDPVKFASQQRGHGDARSNSGAPSPQLNHGPSFQPQILMRKEPSNTSSGSHLGRSPVIRPSVSNMALRTDLSDPKALQAHVAEIKKVYRSLSSMEADLQEVHQVEVEKARQGMADYTPPDTHDASYWIAMISKHRQLAELHSSFLEMSCRPDLPRELQQLAEVRNIPSRLWQTAFHLMLESLRSSLSSDHHLQTRQRKSELLDHLTEFIYYAYSFYSALQESEQYKSMRRAWIESLGDLSRYRMAVAGLASTMALDDGEGKVRNPSDSITLPVDARIDDDDSDSEGEADDSVDPSLADDSEHHARHRPQHHVEESADPRRRYNADARVEAAPANEFDKASIGTAALGDWEWTEKETWRQTAKGWYAMGITKTPNIGRLHHHLGVLSRGDNDLRALYHLTKSLIAAKPFASARDSILTLFDQERQARRVRRDSSIEELFLHLHGILITRVQLDDFDSVFDRLMAKLTWLLEQQGPAGLPQSVWTMMGAVNIAGLYQYGADDSVLADLLLQQSNQSGARQNKAHRSRVNAPTAILVSSNLAKTDDNFLSELPRDAEWDDPSDDESEAGEEVQMISLEAKGGTDDQNAAEELPHVLERAAVLCFGMQSLTFDLASADAAFRSNPYNTTLSTFLISLCQSKKAFRMLERFVPWHHWLKHVEASVSLTERNWPKCLSSSYITAQLLLPEDFCLRGVLGLSRHLYDRNLWRNAVNDGAIAAPQGFDNEVEVLDADDAELYTRTESAWRIAASRRRDGGDSPTSLDTVRGYRLAFVARKLAKAARGFDLDTKSSTLSLSKMLLARLTRRKLEEEQVELERRIRELQLVNSATTAATARTEDQGVELEDDDDFDSDWDSDSDIRRGNVVPASTHEILANSDADGLTEEIKALHARRCYLQDVLKSVGQKLSGQRPGQSRQTKGSEAVEGHKNAVAQANASDDAVPGYTVLVVDTNIIVTPGQVIAQLIESRRWTVIIPLAVITELDGLRRNDNELGQEAERAIQFLESRIKSHAKYVKVQTSRGNYLSDLSCRSEDIDFTWQGTGNARAAAAATPDGSPRLDAAGAGETKSVAARNVDEVILRILAWQKENFVDRRNLLQTNSGESGEILPASTQKSVLLTLDRNLRIKAKSRGLPSLDAKGAARLVDLAAST
ncbi:PINc domain-containing protein [Pseudozyma hubeiensis]|nr:PINc domain-containing protein [Pseudozyma hubeiensis]